MVQEIDLWRPIMARGPFREMEERMDRLFEQAFGRPLRRLSPTEEAWMPAVEVFERNGDVVIRADLPGIKRDDITVEIDNHALTIAGERNAESEVKEKDYYRCERTYGSFRRTIGLPTGVDETKVDASYRDGVLEVKLPKAKGEASTKVAIK